MKNYNDCAFTLKIPTCVWGQDNVNFATTLMYKKGNSQKIIFYKAVLKDKLGREYECVSNYYFAKGKVMYPFKVHFESNGQKFLAKKSYLTLEFLSDNGEKTIVEFLNESNSGCNLNDVRKADMTHQEKEIYKGVLLGGLKNVEKLSENIGSDHVNKENVGIAGYNLPGMDRYIDALREEKNFLKHEGGKKYKITNGKLIGNDKGIYTYAFELESELYLSDDAPISLIVGLSKYSGSVLLCEDFEIVILLNSNIGEKVGSAYINVEPWKLLELLEDKLSKRINIGGSVAKAILKDGPMLATKQPIENIEKGQEAVISRAMKEPVTIVWGPPGTGKTHTMSELAIKYMQRGESVLIVSHSNVSVDGVAKKIYELIVKKNQRSILNSGKVLRYGYIRDEQLNGNEYISSFKYAVKKCPQLDAELEVLQKRFSEIKKIKGIATQEIVDIHKRINKIRGQIKEEEEQLVRRATVVATTISKVVMDKLFDDRKFDVVMFDEVSMAYVLQIVCAASYAKKHMVCVGDFMQLPPIAQGTKKDILCEDIFTYLKINVDGKPFYHPWLVMLDEQRRMYPKISAFANKYVYQHMLKNHESVLKNNNTTVIADPFKGTSVNMIDLTGAFCAASKNQDHSRFNIMSAVISVATALQAEKNIKNVSIITPYAAQTRLIRALLQDYKENNKTQIRFATVHQFQGSESNIVLFDAVESYPGSKVGFLMGKDLNSVKRLINVAVTRAKGKLITVCNQKFWENAFKGKGHTLYKLIEYSAKEGKTLAHKDSSLEKYIESFDLGKTVQFYKIMDECKKIFEKDIRGAKQKIVISLPSGKLKLSEELYELICKAKDKGVQILAKSNEYSLLPEEWKRITCGTDNAVFPIIMIDDKVTWYGIPQADWTFKINKDMNLKTVCNIIFRINGKCTAELIKSLSSLEYCESKGLLSPLIEKDGKKAVSGDGKEVTGLAAYVEKNLKCPKCKHPLKMTKNKKGVTILWCDKCKKVELLTTQEVDRYISLNHVKCPKEKCNIEAKLGKKGIYIKCFAGHYLKPEEI